MPQSTTAESWTKLNKSGLIESLSSETALNTREIKPVDPWPARDRQHADWPEGIVFKTPLRRLSLRRRATINDATRPVQVP